MNAITSASLVLSLLSIFHKHEFSLKCISLEMLADLQLLRNCTVITISKYWIEHFIKMMTMLS